MSSERDGEYMDNLTERLSLHLLSWNNFVFATDNHTEYIPPTQEEANNSYRKIPSFHRMVNMMVYDIIEVNKKFCNCT